MQKWFIEKNNALDYLISRNGLIDGGLPFKILKLCDSSSMAIDIGANAGYYTLPFAEYFTSVHSFEPVKGIAKKLSRNVDLNNYSNVEIHLAACGQTDGTTSFYVQDSIDGDFKLNTGLSSKIERLEYLRSEIVVPQIAIDSLFSGSSISVIKIDVEGAEYEVLKGATKVIRESSPILIWESSVKISRSNVLSCLVLLEELGYESYLIDAALLIKRLRSEEVDGLGFDSNVISLSSSSPHLNNLQKILLE
jgi:FkbM family methyltransferase